MARNRKSAGPATPQEIEKRLKFSFTSEGIPDQKFTEKSTSEILEKYVFRTKGPLKDLRFPSPEALKILSENLNSIRDRFIKEELKIRKAEYFYNEYVSALNKLDEILPHLICDATERKMELKEIMNDREFNGESKSLNEIMEKEISEFKEIHKIIYEREQPFWRPAYTKVFFSRAKWRDAAGTVANDLRKAIASTNSEIPLGNSQGGPVARFVHKVIPLITGDEPDLATVSNWLMGKVKHTGDKLDSSNVPGTTKEK
jgi:hypothetical protein